MIGSLLQSVMFRRHDFSWDSEVNMPHFIYCLFVYEFSSSIFLDKMLIENVYRNMGSNPVHNLPMIL